MIHDNRLRTKVLMILGMHRSGTSCLAGSLQKNGVYLGDVHTYNPHNTKGNRENPTIVQLNNEVLTANKSSWDSPPKKPLEWSDSHLTEQRSVIISDMNKTASAEGCPYWGFKDPRTLLTLIFWQDSPLDINYVGTFRHPLSVATSLHKRSGMPLATGIALWDAYNSILLKQIEVGNIPLVCFDLSNEKYVDNLNFLYESLLLENSDKNSLFFDKELRTNKDNLVDHPLSEKTLHIYQQLLNIHAKQLS